LGGNILTANFFDHTSSVLIAVPILR